MLYIEQQRGEAKCPTMTYINVIASSTNFEKNSGGMDINVSAVQHTDTTANGQCYIGNIHKKCCCIMTTSV